MPYNFSLVHRRSTSSECRASEIRFLQIKTSILLLLDGRRNLMSLIFAKHVMKITFKSILNPETSLYQLSNQYKQHL